MNFFKRSSVLALVCLAFTVSLCTLTVSTSTNDTLERNTRENASGIVKLSAMKCESPVFIEDNSSEVENFSIVDEAVALAGKSVDINLVSSEEGVADDVADVEQEILQPEQEISQPEEDTQLEEESSGESQLVWANVERGSDLWWLAKLIHAEAEGEPWEGKLAVGNVVLNRKNSPRFPDTIKGVIHQKNQFSVVGGRLNLNPNQESLEAANAVLNGETAQGMTPNVFWFNSIRPVWWPGVELWKTIGGHYFGMSVN